MQRPVMNPEFFESSDNPECVEPPRRLKVWIDRLRRGAKAVVRLALKRPFARKSGEIPEPLWYRLAAGALYRFTVVVILAALSVVVMLRVATHPRSAAANTKPAVEGLYYDPVSFLSLDGLRLDAWLIPALDARRVLAEQDEALRQKQPAVILVHDFAHSRREMLPLVRPLHEAGFLVLALSLRGCGSSAASAQTFGLREWQDVEAAANMLRRRPFVDPARIAAIGIGAGANAIRLAARDDPALNVLVLQNPIPSFDVSLDRYVLPPILRHSWVRTTFRWSFDAVYRLDADQLDNAGNLDGRHVLMLRSGLPNNAEVTEQMCQFLQVHLGMGKSVD
jgi:pimeloyl-ACP methyl ester carboxylesterase